MAPILQVLILLMLLLVVMFQKSRSARPLGEVSLFLDFLCKCRSACRSCLLRTFDGTFCIFQARHQWVPRWLQGWRTMLSSGPLQLALDIPQDAYLAAFSKISFRKTCILWAIFWRSQHWDLVQGGCECRLAYHSVLLIFLRVLLCQSQAPPEDVLILLPLAIPH